MEKIQSYIEDEAFMLLGNAGLTTAILIDHGFHLVLHGHKHKRFTSRIRHCSESMVWKQPLTIVGGKKAIDGFNVIRFSRSGNADLIAYEMEDINYDPQPPIQLWSYNEWKSWNWDNQKQIYGYYKEAFVQISISNIGDVKESIRIRQIIGSDTNSIEKIVFDYRAIPEDRAALRVDSLYDFQKKREVELGDANRPQAHVSTNLILDPVATPNDIHGGYDILISGRNIFSVTTNDAILRPKGSNASGVDDKHECYSFHLKYPVEELELWLRFPQGFEPEQVEIICKYLDSKGKDVDIDFPETSRSQSCLDYASDFGVLCFKMKRITPNNRYYITWELPELKMESIIKDQEIDAKTYFDELFNYQPKDKNSWINKQLRQLKSDLLNADIKDAYPDREALDVGFFVLSPKRRELVPVGGTYKYSSNYWKFYLPWGMGIRGLALRRGQPEFFPFNPHKKPRVYVKPDHCEEDKFLLAVPIVIPPGIRSLRNEHSPGFFKAVVCVGSPSESSGLNKLRNSDKMEEICDIIKKMGQNMWKESPLA